MLSKHKRASKQDVDISQILENDKISHKKKLQLLKMQQFSEAYLDKFDKQASSPSIGSGGGSSDEKDEEQQRLLKKRKFKDFVKFSANYASKEDSYGDETKLFKILEQERIKKAKLTHSQALTQGVYANFDY